MTKAKKQTPLPKYQRRIFKVKETVLTTQPKCMPVNLAEEKAKFIQSGKTPQFQLQDPSKLNEVAEKARNQIRFDLQGEALHILEHVLNEYGDGEAYLEHAFGPRISKEEATPLLLEYITENLLSESLTVHWCDNLACSAKMMWKGPVVNCNRPELRKYSLWINGSDDNNYMRESGIRCLMDHEIGTHFFRMLNDGFQPWFSDRAKFGLRRSGSFESKCSEEGLATINTILRGRVKLLWGAAFAYYTACKSAEMTFKQLFDHMGRYTSNPNYRWKQVMRVKRGLKDPNDLGGFGNDQCYFEGAVTILRNMENIDFYLLMSGKVCYDEVDRIKRVVRKECVRYPTFMHKMASYRKALQNICSLNGLNQQHPTQNPPAAYLQRLDERKASYSDDDVKAKKVTSQRKLGAAKNRKNSQTSKSGKSKKKKINRGEDDGISDIESFKISSNFVNMRQYKEEEARRKEETCQIYKRFESVTTELTTLDLTIEQKIRDLRNIVKEHSWSNSDIEYKVNLLNQASCELMIDSSLASDLRIMSALAETVSEENCPASIRPMTSLAVLKHPKNSACQVEFKNAILQESYANKDFNSNSCQNTYFKKKRTKENESAPRSNAKRKKKTAVLTDNMINEKVVNLREKFMSDVNPYEIIFLDMPDVNEDQTSVATPEPNNVIIDIKDDITSVLTPINSDVKSGDAGDAGSDHSKSGLALANKCNMPAGTRQVPNFILRNKLLTKRASVNSTNNSDNILNPDKFLRGKNDSEVDSDSDDSASGNKNAKKSRFAHIVSQYAQHKPAVVQKPKLDRDRLTADLCKPFFIQGERLLQAEKVLKKTRSHSHRTSRSFFPAHKH